MCDSFVAVGSATADGALVFGKNSDRPAGEEQIPIYCPARHRPAGALVHCTYIEIPEAAETYAVLLSQPTWMWGAEIGVNERGVVIGNEAVWTKAPLGPPALLGMDLVRLGLERGATARQALEVITTLLEAHGQGGPCADQDPGLQYHNSFLIADVGEAWVLETAGRHWTAERVTNGVRNISNQLSIRRGFSLASEGLGDHARKAGWTAGEDPVDFAAAFGWEEPGEQLATRSTREVRGRQLLAKRRGRFFRLHRCWFLLPPCPWRYRKLLLRRRCRPCEFVLFIYFVSRLSGQLAPFSSACNRARSGLWGLSSPNVSG